MTQVKTCQKFKHLIKDVQLANKHIKCSSTSLEKCKLKAKLKAIWRENKTKRKCGEMVLHFHIICTQ